MTTADDADDFAAGGADDKTTPFASLRVAAVIAPAFFVAAVIAVTLALAERVPLMLLISAGVLVVTAAASLFSSFVFHVIERGEGELRARNRQLAAVQSATASLSSETELHPLLERFVELSRTITNARYAALAIYAQDGAIAEFITSGISEEDRTRIGHPPVGKGVLGVILKEGAAVRLRDIHADPRSYGFPAHHPPMKSLLGVPVVSKGTPIGNLYLTDKEGGAQFSRTDEEMVRLFASHAAVAVENARLNEHSRALAVLQERERIGMDLHDGVIQSLYGVGLTLEDARDSDELPEVRERVGSAVERLDTVMKDIRSYIYHLRPESLTRADFADALLDLAREFEANAWIPAKIQIDAARPLTLDPRVSENLYQIAREALSNVARHASASSVSLRFAVEPGALLLSIEDDGRGIVDPAPEPGHHGIANMHERARKLKGTLAIRPRVGGGTFVELTVPAALEEHG